MGRWSVPHAPIRWFAPLSQSDSATVSVRRLQPFTVSALIVHRSAPAPARRRRTSGSGPDGWSTADDVPKVGDARIGDDLRILQTHGPIGASEPRLARPEDDGDEVDDDLVEQPGVKGR